MTETKPLQNPNFKNRLFTFLVKVIIGLVVSQIGVMLTTALLFGLAGNALYFLFAGFGFLILLFLFLPLVLTALISFRGRSSLGYGAGVVLGIALQVFLPKLTAENELANLNLRNETTLLQTKLLPSDTIFIKGDQIEDEALALLAGGENAVFSGNSGGRIQDFKETLSSNKLRFKQPMDRCLADAETNWNGYQLEFIKRVGTDICFAEKTIKQLNDGIYFSFDSLYLPRGRQAAITVGTAMEIRGGIVRQLAHREWGTLFYKPAGFWEVFYGEKSIKTPLQITKLDFINSVLGSKFRELAKNSASGRERDYFDLGLKLLVKDEVNAQYTGRDMILNNAENFNAELFQAAMSALELEQLARHGNDAIANTLSLLVSRKHFPKFKSTIVSQLLDQITAHQDLTTFKGEHSYTGNDKFFYLSSLDLRVEDFAKHGLAAMREFEYLIENFQKLNSDDNNRYASKLGPLFYIATFTDAKTSGGLSMQQYLAKQKRDVLDLMFLMLDDVVEPTNAKSIVREIFLTNFEKIENTYLPNYYRKCVRKFNDDPEAFRKKYLDILELRIKATTDQNLLSFFRLQRDRALQ